MTAKIELKVGERIPLSKGGLSELVYLGEAGCDTNGKNRRLHVRCPCGTAYVGRFGYIRTHPNARCIRCCQIERGKQKTIPVAIGTRFGRLTVKSQASSTLQGRARYLCECACGKNKIVDSVNLRKGVTESCGCIRIEKSIARLNQFRPVTPHNKQEVRVGDYIGIYKIFKLLNNGKCVATNTVSQKTVRTSVRNLRMRTKTPDRLRLSALIGASLRRRGFSKKSRTFQIIGADYETVMAHLGPKPKGKVHIDHVCPCAIAKNEEELIKLQHYTNLRWMKAKDNLSKSDNWTPEGAAMCKKLLGRTWRKPKDDKAKTEDS